jgi:hypothetical protein
MAFMWLVADRFGHAPQTCQLGHKFPGAFTFVETGTQADTGWVCTSDLAAQLVLLPLLLCSFLVLEHTPQAQV